MHEELQRTSGQIKALKPKSECSKVCIKSQRRVSHLPWSSHYWKLMIQRSGSLSSSHTSKLMSGGEPKEIKVDYERVPAGGQAKDLGTIVIQFQGDHTLSFDPVTK